MQKKEAWQEEFNKQNNALQTKKIGIWVLIIAGSILFLGGLVFLANQSGSPTTSTQQLNLPKVNENDIIEGEKNAKVTLVEYADFQCPACANYNPLVNQLLENYKGKLLVVYRFFPLTSIHKNAISSAVAAYGANKQGKFGQMKDLLYDKQSDWENLADPTSVFEGYASVIGLNMEQFKKDMEGAQAKAAVTNGEKEALGLGLNSTPTFFLGNRHIAPKGYEDFKALIDEQLK